MDNYFIGPIFPVSGAQLRGPYKSRVRRFDGREQATSATCTTERNLSVSPWGAILSRVKVQKSGTSRPLDGGAEISRWRSVGDPDVVTLLIREFQPLVLEYTRDSPSGARQGAVYCVAVSSLHGRLRCGPHV